MAIRAVMRPRSGDVYLLDREASVQFGSPILFRVIRVHDWETYAGWVWLDGYQLNSRGDATGRRDVFVQLAGLRRVSDPVADRPVNGRRSPNGRNGTRVGSNLARTNRSGTPGGSAGVSASPSGAAR